MSWLDVLQHPIGYRGWLNALQHPTRYHESWVELALKKYWPALFPGYTVEPPNTVQGLKDWKPDIFSVRWTKPDTVIIGEVKSRTGTRSNALGQVWDYTARFHKVHHRVPVIPIVFGPWRQDCLFEIEKIEIVNKQGCYSIGLVQIELLGDRILQVGEILREKWQGLLCLPDDGWVSFAPRRQFESSLDLLLGLVQCPIQMADVDVLELRQLLAIDTSGLDAQTGLVSTSD